MGCRICDILYVTVHPINGPNPIKNIHLSTGLYGLYSNMKDMKVKLSG